MPPLTDAVILGQFRVVLAEWRYSGYVTAKEEAIDWITNNLGGLKLKDVAKAMHDFVANGGIIDQVKETRPEWNIRFPLAGREIYIETILQDDDPNDPTIHIVSIQDA